MDLALNNLQRSICHKTQATNQPTNQSTNQNISGLQWGKFLVSKHDFGTVNIEAYANWTKVLSTLKMVSLENANSVF